MENVSVPFSEVPPGCEFESRNTKRHFYGVKIQETEVVAVGSGGLHLASNDRDTKIFMNTVITKDHMGKRADDAGTLIAFCPDTIVEVEPSCLRET
jgi:hypothetical protein